MPVALRGQVWQLLQPQMRLNICDVASQVAEARKQRQAALHRACRAFAACHTLTSHNAALVLGCLQYSQEAQVDAIVSLWCRVNDKANLAHVLVQLGDPALQALQSRLGCFNFLRHIGTPFGARLRFDIERNADHAAAAQQLCQSAAALQAVWQEAHLAVKLERKKLEHAVKACTETVRRRSCQALNMSVPARPETLAELLAAQEALQMQSARLRPDVPEHYADRHRPAGLADMSKAELKQHFVRYFRALWDLQELPAVVLQNVCTDGKPLVGRATLQLQHLWADVAGHASILEVDCVPYALL